MLRSYKTQKGFSFLWVWNRIMLRSKENVSSELLAKVFKQLCEENQTGILQVITKKVEVISFAIQAGKIVSIKYRTKQNNEALNEVGAIEEGKYTFFERQKVDEIDVDIDPPTNEKVLDYLLGEPVITSSDPIEIEVEDNKLSEGEKEILKTALTHQIGPIAGLMCKEVFAQATDLNTAINMLATKIPDVNLAQSFKAETKSLLQ